MYLRFATFRIDPDARRRQGVFNRAYALLGADATSQAEREHLRAALAWFERDLRVPRVREPRAVFWFKAGCVRCTRHAWDLANALEAAGVYVVPLRTRKPGRVVYEDDCQVAAVPYRDTFRSRSRPPGRRPGRPRR